MRVKPGGFLWLLAHDLRLSRRGFFALFGRLSLFKIVVVLVVAFVALHVVAGGVVLALARLADGPTTASWFAAGALATLSWMIAQSLTGSMRALYARGDFDLLFASPIAPLPVLASRALALVAEAAASSLLLLAPVANMGALFGRTSWLSIYPTLVGSAFFATAAGLTVALALFRIFGPRRARLVSQLTATLIGATFVLGAQAIAVLPDSWRAAIFASAPTQESWLLLPARAALGEPGALVRWGAVAVGAFILVVLLAAGPFARSAALAAGAVEGGPARRAERAFRPGVRPNLRAKERRLVLRDPWLLSQIFMQILYTLPLSVVLFRSGGVAAGAAIAFAPSLVAIAAQLAGALAWVALSGEDAPDFLASAPVARREIDFGKLEAIAGLILAAIAVPMIGLALIAPFGALAAFVFGLGAAASSALVNLWTQTPAPRRSLMQRHAQSKLVGLLEHAVSFLWAVACALAIFGSWTALLPIGIACGTLWLSRRRKPKKPLAPSIAAAPA